MTWDEFKEVVDNTEGVEDTTEICDLQVTDSDTPDGLDISLNGDGQLEVF